MALVTLEYIFIHVYKAGGNSIRRALGSPTTEFFGAHCDAKSVRQGMIHQDREKEWDAAFKFGIVRNPYDWLVSTYFYHRQSKNLAGHPAAKGGFESWLLWTINVAMENKERQLDQNKYLTQKHFLYDSDDCIVDYIGRMESIQESWDHICDTLGRKHSQITHANRTASRKGTSYEEIMRANPDAISVINKVFGEDFSAFNYPMLP